MASKPKPSRVVENVYGLTQAPSFRPEWKGRNRLLFGIEALLTENVGSEMKLVVDDVARLLDAGLTVVDAKQLPNHWWQTIVPPKVLKPNAVKLRPTLCTCKVEETQRRKNFIPRVMVDVKAVVGTIHVGAGNESSINLS